MALVSLVYQDGSGNAIGSATVNIYEAGTTSHRAIYSDEALSTSIPQPWTSPADGKVEFFTAGGLIRVVISKTGFTTYDRDNIEVLDRSEHPLLTGRVGGETQYGSPASGESYTIRSNPSNNGKVLFGSNSVFDESSGKWGMGTTTPTQALDVRGTAFIKGDVGNGAVDIETADGGQKWRFQSTQGSGAFIFRDATAGQNAITVLAGTPTNTLGLSNNGQVGIGVAPGSIDVDAVLEVASTTGGVLFPRMTTTQRDALASPPDGLVIYNTSLSKLQVRAGGAWVSLH